MSRKALITGMAGQDGAYLCAALCRMGYEVHGLLRWDSRLEPPGAGGGKAVFHDGDLTDAGAVSRLIAKVRPNEIYNLAALSHVKVSFETPAAALEINAKGTLNLLESIRLLGMEKQVRMYQASSSEMFGSAPPPQDENTPMHPRSPYGAAKLAAYWMARIYRESYGIHVSNGILFNHESPLRGVDFVTRKITRAVAEIGQGRREPLALGNLDALRDWGYAGDYVRGMWMMLRQDAPGDYVLATGRAHSVREFAARAFARIGTEVEWTGAGLEETGRDARTGRVLVRVDPQFFRPAEVNALLGNAGRARDVLGWRPEVSFGELVAMMVDADCERLRERRPHAQDGEGEETWRMTG